MKKIADPLISLIVVVLIVGIGATDAPTQEVVLQTPDPTSQLTTNPTRTPEPMRTPIPSATPTSTPRATVLPTNTPTPRVDQWALDIKPVGHEIECDDKQVLNGYYFPDQGGWGNDFCVPGMITRASQFYNPPNHFSGIMSSYPEGVMERMCEINGPCNGFKGGVALVSCASVGASVWLRPTGKNWTGPYLVVDCGAREHVYYHHAVLNLAVEVGYATTQRWGFVRAGYIEVSFGGPREGNPVSIGGWWIVNVLEWEPFEPDDCSKEWFDISPPLCDKDAEEELWQDEENLSSFMK